MKRILSGILAFLLVLSLLPAMPLTVQAATSGDYTYTVSNGEATITISRRAYGNITIPSTLGGYPVTGIDDQLFFDCDNLTSITIPAGVTSIGRYAFWDCDSLTSVTIGNGLKSIGDHAFGHCDSLTSATIPDGVITIGTGAFADCCLTSINIPDSVTTIGNYAFRRCDLTSITIPDDVTSIGNAAFYACSSLTSATILDGVTTIGDSVFGECTSLTSITIPDSVTSIGNSAFYLCRSLTSITIPDSVTSIGNSAFCQCYDLTSITIPDGVTSIGESAFSSCRSLKDVWYTGTETQREEIAIGSGNDCLENATWYYNFCGANAHTYTDVCDDACDTCGVPRTPPHIYDNACDTQCNLCGIVRIRDHVYDNACDTQCNVCSLVRTVGDHVYDNDCDTQCNVCSFVRTVGDHVYDNDCDTQCNVCAFERTVGGHQYTLNGELTCSICKYSKAPAIPAVLAVSTDSLTLVSKDGVEYSMDGITWQDSPTFDNLTQNTQYTFYQRVKASDNALVSEPSVGLAVDFPIWSVQYDANGGENAPDSQMKNKGIALVLTEKVPTYAGHIFKGWSTKPYGNVEYISGSSYDQEQDLYLYAVWARDCTVCNGTGKLWRDCSDCDGKGYYYTYTSECCNWDYHKQSLVVDGSPPITWYTCLYCDKTCSLRSHYHSCPTQESYTCTGCNGSKEEKTPHAVAAAPVMKDCTSWSVIIVQQEDMEYSKDGQVWQSSPEFVDLEPGTYYTFYQRYVENNAHSPAETLSPGLTVSTKNSRPKPAAPTISSYSDTKVTLVPINGCEYSKDGEIWQSSNVFTDLLPARGYTFYQRYAATADLWCSPMSDGSTVVTDKSKQTQIPGIPAVESFTSNSITLVAVDGCEYSKNGTTWQSSNVFSGLSCGTEYTFYQRYEETTTTYAGKSSEAFTAKTDKGTQSRPSAPTLSGKTHNSVTLYARSGYEYSRDGVNWQTSNVFTGLEAETNYVFYQRKTETATYYTSEASTALTVKTNEAPAYISGDLDDDFEITDWDGVLLARYLAGWTVSVTNIAAMDIDGDGEVTDWDGVVLDRYLAGWNVTIG